MGNSTLKKISSDLKFVYSDNDSISVVFQNNDLLMGVVGEFNSNLKELEKLTNTNIYFRGNSILIKSDTGKNEIVKNAIQFLAEQFIFFAITFVYFFIESKPFLPVIAFAFPELTTIALISLFIFFFDHLTGSAIVLELVKTAEILESLSSCIITKSFLFFSFKALPIIEWPSTPGNISGYAVNIFTENI